MEGQPAEAAREQVMDLVRRSFRPEFLNRLDEIILFNRLGRKEMKRIVDIQLRHLQQLLAERKIVLDVDEKAKTWLANTGYDPVYGARPLKRVIQRALQNPLANMLLSGAIKDGDTVTVTVAGWPSSPSTAASLRRRHEERRPWPRRTVSKTRPLPPRLSISALC